MWIIFARVSVNFISPFYMMCKMENKWNSVTEDYSYILKTKNMIEMSYWHKHELPLTMCIIICLDFRTFIDYVGAIDKPTIDARRICARAHHQQLFCQRASRQHRCLSADPFSFVEPPARPRRKWDTFNVAIKTQYAHICTLACWM